MFPPELYINDEQIELSDKSVVAITRQVADLSEPGKRFGNTTNRMKAPKTNRNREILGFSDTTTSGSEIPYRGHSARIVAGGLDVVPDGKAIVDEANENFEIIVRDGNLDFFDQIAGLRLSDLDLSDLETVWNISNVLASRTNTTGMKWQIIDFGGLSNLNNTFDVRRQLPSVFVHTLVDRIISNAGFTKAGDFFTANQRYLKSTVPCITAKIKRKDYKSRGTYTGPTSFDHPTSPPTVQLYSPLIVPTYDPESLFMNQYIGLIALTASGYVVANDGSYTFKTSFRNYDYINAIQSTIYIMHHRPSTGSHTVVAFNTMTASESGTVLELECAPIQAVTGDIFYYYFSIGLGSTLDLDSIDFNCTRADCPQISYGNTFLLSDNLPDMDQKDFIKGIMNQYHIIPQTNNLTKVVTWKQFDDVKNNIGNAIDWSEKIDNDDHATVKFRLGNTYAQRNLFKYTKDQTVLAEYGDGSILVDDETLPSESILVELKFASTESTNKLDDIDVPLVSVWDSSTGLFSKKVVGRMLIDDISDLPIVSPPKSVEYTDGTTSVIIDTDVPLAYFSLSEKPYSLDFPTLIEDNYQTLVEILDRTKWVEDMFVLNEKDIKELDHFIPVHITVTTAKKSINGFFYVNKVDQWIRGRKARVELIRL